MSMVLTQISPTRSGYALADQLSIEASVAEHTELVDQQINEVISSHGEVREHVAEIVAGENTVGGIEALTDSMIASAGEKGLDEPTAKAYSDSLEALLAASGIKIPAEAIIPSFECGENFSFEAEEKKENILVRMWKWLGEALSKFAEMIRGFFSRIWTTIPNLRKLARSLKAKVDTLKGDPKKGGDISIGGQVQYLVDETGIVHKPSVIAGKIAMDYRKFLTDWVLLWGDFHNLETPTAATFKSDEVYIKIVDVVKSMKTKLSSEKRIKFHPIYSILVTPGRKKEDPLDGVKVKIEKTPVQVKSAPTALSISDMRSGIDDVLKAVDEMDKLKTDIDKLVKTAQDSAQLAFRTSVKAKSDENTSLASEVNASMKPFRYGLLGMASGYTDTMPHYLQSVRAVLKYIAAGAKRYDSSATPPARAEAYDPSKDAGAHTHEHKPEPQNA